MAKKRGFKHSLSYTLYNQPKFNKKVSALKDSFDEAAKVLNGNKSRGT